MTEFLTQRTEYQLQFTWKQPELVKIDVVKHQEDHLQRTSLKPLDPNWRSEYKRQFGFNVTPLRTEQLSTATMTGWNNLDASVQTSPVKHLPAQNASTMATIPKVAAAVQTSGLVKRIYQTEPVITSLDVETMSKPVSRSLVGKRPQVNFTPLEHVDITAQTSPIKFQTSSTETIPLNRSEVTQTNPPTTSEAFTEPLMRKAHDTEPYLHLISKKINGSQKSVMVQYGQGNTRPVTPDNYLKTFNVRAPVEQIYEQTRGRSKYMDAFKRKENIRTSSPKTVSNVGLPNPKLVMKEYLKAKDLVSRIQTRYKSEYQGQFINWNQPITEIKKQLLGEMSDEAVASKISKYSHPKAAGISSGNPPVAKKARSDLTAVKLPHQKQAAAYPNNIPVDYSHVQNTFLPSHADTSTNANLFRTPDNKLSLQMSAKDGEDVLFRSTAEIDSKELDYILVWDQKSSGYVLEKLSSTVILQPARGSGISPQQKAKIQQIPQEEFKLEEDSAPNEDDDADDFGDLDSLMEEITSNASAPVHGDLPEGEVKPRSLFDNGDPVEEEAYQSE